MVLIRTPEVGSGDVEGDVVRRKGVLSRVLSHEGTKTSALTYPCKYSSYQVLCSRGTICYHQMLRDP